MNTPSFMNQVPQESRGESQESRGLPTVFVLFVFVYLFVMPTVYPDLQDRWSGGFPGGGGMKNQTVFAWFFIPRP